MACAALSGSFFLLRGLWMACDSALLQRRWVKTLPHAIDSALLASALALAFWSGHYPLQQPWLTAKLAGLVTYILLGSVALKRGRNKPVRIAALGAALLALSYIASVAVTKNPTWFV